MIIIMQLIVYSAMQNIINFIFQIYLYARDDGKYEHITLDSNVPSTSMRYDNDCSKLEKKSFYLFNAFCFIGLPFFLYGLVTFIIQTSRPKLRGVLSPSLPKDSVNQNLAALVLTGLVFSIYVLICDILALVFTVSKDQLGVLSDYEDESIELFTTVAIIMIFIIDLTAFTVSFLNILFLFCLQTQKCSKNSFHRYYRFVCCMCFCKCVKGYKQIPELSDDSQQILQRVNRLQRREYWLLQQKCQQHQSQPINWLQQWDFELQQQAIRLKQWEIMLKQQNYHLYAIEHGFDHNYWNKSLDDWEDEITQCETRQPTRPAEYLTEVKLQQRQNDINKEQKRLQKEADQLQRRQLKPSIPIAENKAWLLLISFLAPLVCIGTHAGFVVMAWASDPGEASSITVVFTLSFFYYFLGFRQLYIRFASCPCLRLETVQRTTRRRHFELYESINEVSTELDEYHNNLKEINFAALVCEFPILLILMGIEGSVIFAYYYLPGPISSVPLNVMNLLQLVLFFGTGLITYKLFTFSTPMEEVILDKFLKAYNPQDSSSKDVAERVGETLGNALKRVVERSRHLTDNSTDSELPSPV